MELPHHQFISKSTYLNGLQCHKLLWFRINARDQIPPVDERTQASFDQGTEIGELAHGLFPGGVVVAPRIIDRAIVAAETQKAILKRRPLFEAGFFFHGGFARADILNPVANGAWDLIEVKSTNALKVDEHLPDIAFQKWVLTGAGLKIRRCYLCHINKTFVRKGKVDPHKFFTLEDVTGKISALTHNVEADLDSMRRVIGLKAHPEIQIGPHCTKPHDCPLHDHCWSFLPEDSVFTLYNDRSRKYKLFAQGIHHLKDIPADVALTDNQAIQRSALLAGKPHVDRTALAAFLGQLEYPVSFLDFETFNEAIPRFDDSRPFQQIPFQFSLHILRTANAQPEHRQFLAEGTTDPRPEFMRQLRDALPETGSVVSFNAGFETRCLKQCCDLLTEFKPWFKKVQPRIVDLLLPFRGFRYYHPKQNGSASMKAVLPALTGKGYENLEIQEGGAASREFLRVTYGQVTTAERCRVRQHLEEYCGLDTMGMVEIINSLRAILKT